MQILDFVKVHYNQCMKDYLYIGLSIVFLAIFLRIGFWGLYTIESDDISQDDELLVYPDYSDGDEIRIHGNIDEIEYFGEIELDHVSRSELSPGDFSQSSAVYLHGLKVMDNITIDKKIFSDLTLENLLVYDGEIENSRFENVTFENVSFIKSGFIGSSFENVQFMNVSFIDCTIKESSFDNVTYSTGYMRELHLKESILDDVLFQDVGFSRTSFSHLELNNCSIRNAPVNDSEFLGIEFKQNVWENCEFTNDSFTMIIFNQQTLSGCSFTEVTYRNIFIDTTDGFDHTSIILGDIHIRIEGDVLNSYNEGTSIYGLFSIVGENGSINSTNGENITYHYEIFLEKEIHHSLRIDGIFYTFMLGGFTVITYAYGGKAVIMALVKFFLPFIFSSIGILILFLALPWDTFEKLGTWMILYFFPPLGKESVIPAAIAQGIHPLLIAGAVAFIDIMVGLFLVWNFDLARKIPLIGGFIRRIESKGKDILVKKPWVERLAFTGIILFVMFPFQGSGAVGATIVGRMLGMDPRKVWYAVIIGAIVGCLVIAYTSAFAITFLLGIGLAYALMTIALIVIFLVLVYNYDKWGDWVKDHL